MALCSKIKIILIAFLGILCFFVAITSGQVSSTNPSILIVKSGNKAEYDQAIDALRSSLLEKESFSISEVTLNSGNENDFWERAYRNQPDVIISVGTSSTSSAISHVREIPIIFTMVLNHLSEIESKSSSSINTKINGITLSIPVNVQFDLMREAMPFARRVGGLFSKSSITIHQTAQQLAESLGLQLITREITSESDILNGLMEILPEIDVFWLPPDAMIYSDSNILRLILRECYINSVPIIAVSKHLAVAGTPLALGIDYQDIGRQTADLVTKTLSNRVSSNNTIETPRKVDMYINRRVVSGLGLEIPSRVLEKAIPVESER